MRSFGIGRLLIIILLLCGIMASAQRRQSTRPRKSKQELKTNLSAVRNRKAELARKLAVTRAEARIAAGDLHKIDAKLEDVTDQLEKTTGRLNDSKIEQKRLAGELKEAEEQLAEKQKQVSRRLRAMYIRGEGSVIEELINSRSLGEMADRKYILDRIAKLDHALFNEYKELKEKVARQKMRADQLVVEIGHLVDQQEERQQELNVYRDAKAEALGDLQNQQGALERLIAELDAEESSIEAQIAAYNRKVASGAGIKLPPFTGRFSRPVNAPMGNRRFGVYLHPILKVRRPHNGIDFGARSGAPIFAAADGVVISASYGRGFGNHVIIDHGGGISTLYAHCSRMNVRPGQRVKRGQVIAAVGSTGLSTGPHLHWEVRVNGRPVNPLGRF